MPSSSFHHLIKQLRQTINHILQQAHDGSTVDGWDFWLATDNYDDVPGRKPGGARESGTEAPVLDTFKSPFIGQSVTDVIKWLKNKPDHVEIESKFFAILDKKADQTKVVLIRIADNEGNPIEPSFVLKDT